MGKKIAVLGDVHAPFTYLKAIDFFYKHIEQLQPDYIVQIGDLFDFYSSSRFPRSHNIMTPVDEVAKARQFSERMFNHIQKLCPQSKLYLLVGNHDVRPIKKVLEVAPELEELVRKSHRELMTFKGVNTIHDPREELLIDGITFIHGFLSKLGDHCQHFRSNTVVGHSHRGGTYFERFYVNGKEKIIWELNAGYVGNPNEAALKYGTSRAFKWTHGFGFINSHVPMFIPLVG